MIEVMEMFYYEICFVVVFAIVFINRKRRFKRHTETPEIDIIDIEYEILYEERRTLLDRLIVYTPWDF